MENRLRWVKDVVFREDTMPVSNHQAAINWSIISSIVINLARRHGYDSFTKAKQMLAHDREAAPFEGG